MGTAMTSPMIVAVQSGATSRIAAKASRIRSIVEGRENSQPVIAAESVKMPSTAPPMARRKFGQVKSYVTSSSAGWNANTNGTSALPIESRNAVFPALKALAPAIPAPA